LTAKEWKEGWKKSRGGVYYQSNCPYLPEMNAV
jgi:hypothetical protein